MGWPPSTPWNWSQNHPNRFLHFSDSSSRKPPSRTWGHDSARADTQLFIDKVGQKTLSILNLGFKIWTVVGTRIKSTGIVTPALWMQRRRLRSTLVLVRPVEAMRSNNSPAPWLSVAWGNLRYIRYWTFSGFNKNGSMCSYYDPIEPVFEFSNVYNLEDWWLLQTKFLLLWRDPKAICAIRAVRFPDSTWAEA